MKPEDLKIIVIGSNHGWGRGDTIKEAKKNACNPKQYLVFACHPETTVSSMDGGLEYPVDFPPKEIDRVGLKVP